MKLSEIKNIIDVKEIFDLKKNKYFSTATSNSKLVEKNSIFFYNQLSKSNKKYIKEAIYNKASALITNRKQNNINIPQFIVEDIEKQKEILLNKLYPFAPKKILAVTGTNGKTSVVWYVSKLLNNLKIKNKTIGTLGYYINGIKYADNPLTTPAYEELIKNSFSKKKNNSHFVFEASSHSLHQKRLKNLSIDVAVLTNITNDHLDYHITKAEYKKSKLALFKKHLKKDGIAIINSSIKNIAQLKNYLVKKNIKIIYFGSNNIYFLKKNDDFILHINKRKYVINNLKLNSIIELENLECAISCCIALGIDEKKIISKLKFITNPPGRLQKIKYDKKGSSIIVDYAHTPDALQKILTSQTIKNKKPSLLFGCGGDRDKDKRILMSKIASKYASKIYITDDNPRWENSKSIRKSLLKYCPNAIEIPKRKKAIQIAIKNIVFGETLIIAGKGHEKFQIIKNKKYKFDDYEIAKQLILK